MATAKLIWRDPSLVQIKLKKGNGEVVLNETYNADLIPEFFAVFDDDGDPFSTKSFASIFAEFSIGYEGIIYSVDVVGKPPPAQTKVSSDGWNFFCPNSTRGCLCGQLFQKGRLRLFHLSTAKQSASNLLTSYCQITLNAKEDREQRA